MKLKITPKVIREARKFLGPDGIEHFSNLVDKYGEDKFQTAVIPGKPPHPIHFREGMLIRNYMRRTDEFRNLTDHELDDTWNQLITGILV